MKKKEIIDFLKQILPYDVRWEWLEEKALKNAIKTAAYITLFPSEIKKVGKVLRTGKTFESLPALIIRKLRYKHRAKMLAATLEYQLNA